MRTESIQLNKSKVFGKNTFFTVSAILMLVQVIILYMVLKTPITEFSQNIIKTFIFSFITISPFYAFLALFRVIKKKDRLMTIKQLVVFVLFALGFFIFNFAADSALVALGLDVDKIPSNIFCFLVMLLYLVLQHVYLVMRHRKQVVC